MHTKPLAAALLTFLSITATAQAADIQVRVLNVADPRGTVRAELCQKPEWLHNGCARKSQSPATPGITTVTFTDVPPGSWAVVAFHDRNNDGEVNRTVLGIPKEGVGFSRNPALGLHGPKFEDCAVPIGDHTAVLDIRLRFE